MRWKMNMGNKITTKGNILQNQTSHSMTMDGQEFPSIWAEAITIAIYLKNWLLHKYMPSSITPDEYYHTKRSTISQLTLF
jgi:hypothetical protein